MNAKEKINEAIKHAQYASNNLSLARARLTPCKELTSDLVKNCEKVSFDLKDVSHWIDSILHHCIAIKDYIEHEEKIFKPTRFELGKFYLFNWDDMQLQPSVACVVEINEFDVVFQEQFEIRNGKKVEIVGSRFTYPTTILEGREIILSGYHVRADSRFTEQ